MNPKRTCKGKSEPSFLVTHPETKNIYFGGENKIFHQSDYHCSGKSLGLYSGVTG